ncbi:hypothetical protein BP5796_07634 [Coleophoma crateriformis]|uniref:Uncharacterized protein n=1 Tax=Coleophoma crateriformis TaxID=565419 RepID=A0A3D8RJH2_9HELO|nr:hypothetical protein BP5796_07634 [Coleophoma crateriformis]
MTTFKISTGHGLVSSNSPDSLDSTPNPRGTSVESTRSRITLVADDPDTASYQAAKLKEIDEVVRGIYRRKYTWFQHLQAVFCIKTNQEEDAAANVKYIQTQVLEAINEMDHTSPWVLPVFVLSARVDIDKHRLPQQAKCTIDTGNQQGNLVSQDFVENVLEYSKANFHSLTEEEQMGGIGVTGHTLVPIGAIYLTWYHKKSTRVFRDMRFLISPIKDYDLVIGARSIQKDRLLSIPNLMSGSAGVVFTTQRDSEVLEDTGKDNTEKAIYEKSKEINKVKNSLSRATDPAKKEKYQNELDKLTQDHALLEKNRKVKNDPTMDSEEVDETTELDGKTITGSSETSSTSAKIKKS